MARRYIIGSLIALAIWVLLLCQCRLAGAAPGNFFGPNSVKITGGVVTNLTTYGTTTFNDSSTVFNSGTVTFSGQGVTLTGGGSVFLAVNSPSSNPLWVGSDGTGNAALATLIASSGNFSEVIKGDNLLIWPANNDNRGIVFSKDGVNNMGAIFFQQSVNKMVVSAAGPISITPGAALALQLGALTQQADYVKIERDGVASNGNNRPSKAFVLDSAVWNGASSDIYSFVIQNQPAAGNNALLIIGQSSVNNEGVMSLPIMDIQPTVIIITNAALLQANGGLLSSRGNLSAPTSISVTASPFTYTDSDGFNEEVFIVGGTISLVKLNGTTIFTSAGNTSIMIQPNETIQVTYTGAPTMFKKPF